MPEQLSNDWKAETTACANARICVAEVVDADAVQPRAPRYGLPGSFEVGTRLLGIVPGNDVGACPGQTRKHFQGRGVQHESAPRPGRPGVHATVRALHPGRWWRP